MQGWTIGVAVVILLVIAAAFWLLAGRSATDPAADPVAPGAAVRTDRTATVDAQGHVDVTSASSADDRTASPAAVGASTAAPTTSDPDTEAVPAPPPPEPAEGAADDPLAYGTFPAVPADANEQVAKVVAAARSRTDAALQTPVAAIPPFDAKTYREDPQAYLTRAVPARAFQSAAPGQGVPVLRPEGKRFASIAQGESVVLRVRSAPGWPVTFATSDAGLFDNELTTISVEADDEGIAAARFRATTGVVDDVNIQAASPRASGQVQFTVFVRRAPAGDAVEEDAGPGEPDSPRAQSIHLFRSRPLHRCLPTDPIPAYPSLPSSDIFGELGIHHAFSAGRCPLPTVAVSSRRAQS